MKINTNDDDALCTLFQKWKNFVRANKLVSTNTKIDRFLNVLKDKKCTQAKSLAESDQVKQTKSSEQNLGILKFRFEAQKNIIEYQKDKLKKQEKLIQDLKLNKIVEELKNSNKEAESLIRTIFKDCRHKTKHLVKTNDENAQKLDIKTIQIPKIIREIDKKSIDRAHKRKIILERKRLNEESRTKRIQNEIVHKQVLEENERKLIIENMMKHRKRKLHMIQQMRLREQKEMVNNAKADCFYREHLKKLTINRFKKLIMIKNTNDFLSFRHYHTKIITNCWKTWTAVVSQISYEKNRKAEQFYKLKLLHRIVTCWFQNYATCRQDVQVSKDLYDFQLQSKVFSNWLKYCKMIETRNIQKVQQHYINQLLLNYYYRWKLLPHIMKIERNKENKKQRWRNKVKEVLLDYDPVMEESF